MNYRNLKQFSSGNSTDWDKFIVKIRWIFVCAKFFSLSNWSIRFFYLLVNHKPLNIIHWKYIVCVKKNTKKYWLCLKMQRLQKSACYMKLSAQNITTSLVSHYNMPNYYDRVQSIQMALYGDTRAYRAINKNTNKNQNHSRRSNQQAGWVGHTQWIAYWISGCGWDTDEKYLLFCLRLSSSSDKNFEFYTNS